MIWLVVAVAIGFSSIVASAPPPSPVIEAAAAVSSLFNHQHSESIGLGIPFDTANIFNSQTQAVGTPVIGGPSVVAAFPMVSIICHFFLRKQCLEINSAY